MTENNIQTFLTAVHPYDLLHKYGSPLYIYSEDILRSRCREIKEMICSKHFRPQYSAKANTNIKLLQIIRSEGLAVDAMSPGEVLQENAAGYTKDEIMYCSNNMTDAEMRFAHDHSSLIIFDSLSQIDRYGAQFTGENIGIRLNFGFGAGGHKNIITGGNTKFGISVDDLSKVDTVFKKHSLKLIALHQHIGSNFLDGTAYLNAADLLLTEAQKYKDVRILDFGGGFGVPYHAEHPLDIKALGNALLSLIHAHETQDHRTYEIRVEPGRYIAAECGLLLGTVTDIKKNRGTTYLGTDLGFNVLMRPILYQAHHQLHAYSDSIEECIYTVCGNICESGDILASEVKLKQMHIGDILAIENVGAYGFSMSSNYNSRLRPAEVLLTDGKDMLIRKREDYSSLRQQI